ncbi:MAG TPA: protein-L-isoaspartate(D-aspartate) O-methyltransferase [Phycisphaerae bacterium]
MKMMRIGPACVLATSLLSMVFAAAAPAPPAPATMAAGGKPWTPPKFTERQKDREAMVKQIKDFYGLEDQPTLDALGAVPRHEFVPADESNQAYDDSPLPIPNGQLISQPWIVAMMTQQLQLKPTSKVLEIGTGSGYQSAVLTNLTPHVFTIEIIKPLGEAAAARFKRLGYDCIHSRISDGFDGWKEEAPFDAIIVTCAAGQIPPPLLKQLAADGRMMIPVGQPFATQSLMLVTKDPDGTVKSKNLAPVRFVPLLTADPTTQAATTQAK